MHQRKIPSTGELLSAIGMGTWQTFDINSEENKENLKQLLMQMHNSGASLIDTSPMYGNAEKITGEVTQSTGKAEEFFYAIKVWTSGRKEGIIQMENSIKKMQCKIPDLIQIHNLLDWKTHLETLQQWKSEGKVRYIGITHYTDSMHDELAEVIRKNKVDFVQFNYSIFSRNAEKRLLPVAREFGVATIINRPFAEGALSKLIQSPLPVWAAEFGIKSWATLILKFILSHPDVTCVIPATSNHNHLYYNLLAGTGRLPDLQERENWIKEIEGNFN